MAVCPAPRREVDAQRRIAAGDRQPAAGRQRGERAVDEQVPAVVEAEAVKVGSRWHGCCPRRRRSRPRRRPARVARSPPGAAGSHCLSPSRSSSGRSVRVAVVHAEQQLAEALVSVRVGGRARGHVAVVVRRRLGEDPDRAGRQDALPAEQQQVRVDHAGGVHLAGAEQGAGRVALAADVVAVQPDADVEAADGHVAVGIRPAGAGPRRAAATAAAAWPAVSRRRRCATVRPRRSASDWTGESARTDDDRRAGRGRCRAS